MMINPVREYAWGSTTAFSELFGWAASATPRAEIWMGAHPGDPSSLQLAPESVRQPVEVTSLPDYLRGSDQAPGSFPFLLKVLAAEHPLSIQSHPTADRARRGFAAEEAAGIALDAPHRSYKDPNAKPELIVALTEFSALCGFRPHAKAAAALTSLSSAVAGVERPADDQQLPALLDRLHDFVAAQDYAGALEHLLRSGRDATQAAAEELHRFLGRADLPDGHGRAALRDALDPGTREMLAHVSAAFPADPGVFVTLLLNRVRLQPGESIYLPAGNLHAYLHGVGVELMGNSDNVLRGGLTSKPLAVDELLSVTDFGVLPVPHCPVQESGPAPRRTQYQAPFEEFQLELIEFPGETVLDRLGPGIVLCTAGTFTLHAPDAASSEDAAGEELTAAPGTPRMLTLTPGESAFLPAIAGHRLSASAHAQAFLASTTFASQDL
ncbi:mannose-6-phosphate isomerase, class I [Nesterenkonia sp. LB17]|uniref:mannose-6-phosphate isomerase, class I n=1 Tax=Nesterenkonia sp. LB17 TaxID=2901230 RepID=UPI001F4C5358|nr:mannose-6-phosphate isomerase, class I [Nesterenkonia sp. LB17]MCH8565570.1 mannose-6-phosphate isomerase, class I [Nesterenkonia sp. LB17]